MMESQNGEIQAEESLESELVPKIDTLDSPELVDLVFSRSPLPMWIYDMETLRFLEVNDTAIRLYGWSREEFLQMNLLSIRLEEDRGVVRQHINEFEEDLTPTGAWRHRLRSGELIYVDASRQKLTYRGRPAIFVTLNDVTERVQARSALEESEQLYRLITENSIDLITLLDLQGTVLFVSPSVCRMMGTDTQWLLGHNLMEVVHPEDHAEVYRRMRSLKDADQTICFRLRTGETWRWIEAWGGEVILQGQHCILGVGRDVSQRMTTESALHEQMAILRSFFSSSSFFMSVNEWDGKEIRIRLANQKASKFYGQDEQTVLGKTYELLNITEKRQNDLQGLVEKCLQSGEPQSYSLDTVINGEQRTIQGVLSRIESVVSDNPLFSMISTDITEQKRLEAQLAQAQKLEGIGQVAGGIAHDFNNLLTVILGFAELAQESSNNPEELKSFLDNIMGASERASNLTRQLLTFARRQAVEPRILNLNSLLGDVMHLLRPLLGESVELICDFSEELWPVRVDQSQFEQVVLNIAVNARDAMPMGGKLIMHSSNQTLSEAGVREYVAALPGDYVLLEIIDTGTGIPLELQSHIFEPFFTTKPVGKGTGLGLATAYGIVRQSGGYIRVDSRPGEGARFQIILPRMLENVTLQAKLREPASPSGSETLLLVEDEVAVRNMAAQALRALGYTVLVAEHGLAGLECSRAWDKPIDMLVTDLIMPEMGGRQLAEIVLQERPGIRVLYTSGYTDQPTEIFDQKREGVAFLTKPYSMSTLAKRIHALFEATSVFKG